jgi:hypothetical protein
MADDKPQRPTPGQPPSLPAESQQGDNPSLSMDLGMPKDQRRVQRGGSGIDTEAGSGKFQHHDGGPGSDDELDPDAAEMEGEEEAAPEEGAEDGQPEPLPEFDPAKADVVEAYNSRFLSEGDTYNLDALSAEWAANAGGDPAKGTLSEDTYKWLASRGIPKEMAKEIEAGEVAKTAMATQKVYDQAGGKPKYDAAIKWAREGGYDDAARERFNKAVNGKDPKAREDAIDLLMTRHGKAAGSRRPSAPARSTVNAGAGAGSSTPGFASRTEWKEALKAARDANKGQGDEKALNEVRRRYRASNQANW